MGVYLGLLVGLLVVGPVVVYLAGMTNPIGHMGEPPWRSVRCREPGRCRFCGSAQCIGRHR